jgi:hypothetical protein
MVERDVPRPRSKGQLPGQPGAVLAPLIDRAHKTNILGNSTDEHGIPKSLYVSHNGNPPEPANDFLKRHGVSSATKL